MNKKTLWITQTAVFTALLIVMQFATASLGQLVTGSIVNFLLITSTMTCGLSSGICVAALSPIIAKLVGIGPLWTLIPFVILGNVALVLVWHFLGNFGKTNIQKTICCGSALIIAAVTKFLLLYFGIVEIAVPLLLKLPEKKAAAISAMFSYPQLITALVGGIIAIIVYPLLKKLMSRGAK